MLCKNADASAISIVSGQPMQSAQDDPSGNYSQSVNFLYVDRPVFAISHFSICQKTSFPTDPIIIN